MKYLKIVLFLSGLAAGLRLSAQVFIEKKDSLYSNVLEEQRQLQVILPEHYDSSRQYDMLYVIDGEWNTGTFVNIHWYLHAIGFAPSAIIIGVPNVYKGSWNKRDHDFTPSVAAEARMSGGAKQFLAFFKEELIPFVRKKYHPGGDAILFGGSYGGLFTMYVLLTDPSVFAGYLCSDPAFRYDNQWLVKVARKTLSGLNLEGKILYIGGRSGYAYHTMGIAAMDTVLQQFAPSGLKWKVSTYDDETHNSSTFKSNYDALKYFYAGYTPAPLAFAPQTGIVLPDKPVKLSINSDHMDIRYTPDTTLPKEKWDKVDEQSLLVADPERITVKSFSRTGRYDYRIPIGVRTGGPLPALQKINEQKMLTYSFYDYNPDSLLEYSRRIPKARGIVDSAFSLENSKMDAFECLITGHIYIPKAGYYVFQLDFGKGSEIYVNNKLWMTQPPDRKRQSMILPLNKGYYPLKMKLKHNPNEAPVKLGIFQSKDGQDDWWNNPFLRF